MAADFIAEKLKRIASGQPPRVLDLFSGCGGLSLGFLKAGFHPSAAIECDETAASSYAKNVHRDAAAKTRTFLSLPRDMKSDPVKLGRELGFNSIETAIDVIVGGPPCQAYARVGRAKLGDIAEHPHAFKVDPRANLYLRYLEYVSAFQPLALLMENVPDILNFAGHNVADEIAEVLERKGYDVRYALLNAAHYGVPQLRDRVFLIAYRKELRIPIAFPEPTHWIKLPRGYEGMRRVALKHVDLLSVSRYTPLNVPSESLPRAITAKEALGDLPRITGHLCGKMRRGRRVFTDLVLYRKNEPSNYARSMREWPGFESLEGVYDHVIRFLPRDPPIFRAMRPGDEYPAAHQIALELLDKALKKERRRSSAVSPAKQKSLRKSIVPPYPTDTFPNRWWKLRSDGPSRTLMAHLGKDTYSHIHYDSRQARVISVREAARLQSFPDGFKFAGAMNAAFRQIGNAVPPLLAFSLAELMLLALQKAARQMSDPISAAAE